MPEGHTVHRLALDLVAGLSGSAVTASSPQGRFAAGAALIDGEWLRGAEAFGKYLFCEFTGAVLLHVHLGLIGKFRPWPAATVPTESIRLRLENDEVAWQLTGPARCEIVSPEERDAIVAGLGVDPLRPRARIGPFRDRLAATNVAIGAALLDQRVIAGIGNVYRAEILHICGIDPRRPASSLSADEVTAIWAETQRQLRRGVRLGRIVTTDPRRVGRPLAEIAVDDRLHVYHRADCRGCGGDLDTLEIVGRPIQFCPRCQPGQTA